MVERLEKEYNADTGWYILGQKQKITKKYLHLEKSFVKMFLRLVVVLSPNH